MTINKFSKYKVISLVIPFVALSVFIYSYYPEYALPLLMTTGGILLILQLISYHQMTKLTLDNYRMKLKYISALESFSFSIIFETIFFIERVINHGIDMFVYYVASMLVLMALLSFVFYYVNLRICKALLDHQ